MSERELYVGYLPAPKGIARFVRAAVPAIIVGLGLVAGVVAGAMRSPGDGVWDLGQVEEVRGTVRDVGYPVLVAEDGPWLLVGELKSGVRGTLGDMADGAEIVVRGNSLVRGDLRMLSLTASADTIEVVTPGSGRAEADEGRAVSLEGEIVDSKCYLGAMKPGEGKTHKACAILCLKGGVPPLLIGDEGGPCLLVGPDAGEIEPRWLDYVGESVQVDGALVGRVGLYRIVRIERVSRR